MLHIIRKLYHIFFSTLSLLMPKCLYHIFVIILFHIVYLGFLYSVTLSYHTISYSIAQYSTYYVMLCSSMLYCIKLIKLCYFDSYDMSVCYMIFSYFLLWCLLDCMILHNIISHSILLYYIVSLFVFKYDIIACYIIVYIRLYYYTTVYTLYCMYNLANHSHVIWCHPTWEIYGYILEKTATIAGLEVWVYQEITNLGKPRSPQMEV